MAHSRAFRNQAGPVFTSMTLSTYACSKGASGCWTVSGRGTKVMRCLEAMKAFREEACLSASNVYRTVSTRSLALDFTGGG